MFDSPFAVLIFLISSILSSWLLWDGFKRKNVPRLLMGVSATIPSFAPLSFKAWLVAGLFCVASIWLQRYIDG